MILDKEKCWKILENNIMSFFYSSKYKFKLYNEYNFNNRNIGCNSTINLFL